MGTRVSWSRPLLPSPFLLHHLISTALFPHVPPLPSWVRGCAEDLLRVRKHEGLAEGVLNVGAEGKQDSLYISWTILLFNGSCCMELIRYRSDQAAVTTRAVVA